MESLEAHLKTAVLTKAMYTAIPSYDEQAFNMRKKSEEERRRATKSDEERRRATKSDEERRVKNEEETIVKKSLWPVRAGQQT